MKYAIIFLSFLCICGFCPKHAWAVPERSDSYLHHEERIEPEIRRAIQARDFQTVRKVLKTILLDEDLSDTEKMLLLEENSVYAKNLGNFREAGEILELAYTIIHGRQKELSGKDEEEEYRYILTSLHEKLTACYQSIRHWEKVNEAHFYYLNRVPVEHGEKMDILFDIVVNYYNMLSFNKAEKVLEEISTLCQNDHDFARLYYYRGMGCFSRNDYEKTMEVYKKALDYNRLDNDKLGMVYYQLGICNEILQDGQKAVEYYEKALPLYQNKRVIEKRLQKLAGTITTKDGTEDKGR